MLRVISETSTSDTAPSKLPLHRLTSVDAVCSDGFYALERDDEGEFRWMQLTGHLEFEPEMEDRFLEMGVLSEFQDLSQELTVEIEGRTKTFRLGPGWRPVTVPVPAGAKAAELSVNQLFPAAYYPNDPRQLAIRVRRPRLHKDPARHREVAHQQANTEKNLDEMMAGKAKLGSTPQVLGIDMYGVCNVKPPCVYCDWDISKEAEGSNVDTPFTADTLAEWGAFFDNSTMLVNCSIGEPFMMKNFDELLDIFGSRGKFLEMTTNGQILTDRNIEKLLGRNINLYISLDAANAETYAKLRNDKFDRILKNLRRLIRAKGGKSGLPRVFLVFMPMKVNQHELEDFVRLCADLEVDRLILRPLNSYENSNLVWDRAGYTFRYMEELLSWHDLVRISGRAAALCEELGVELSDQLDFGGSLETDASSAVDFAEGRQEIASRPKTEAPPAEGEDADAPVSATVPGPTAEVQAGPEGAAVAVPEELPAPLPSLGAEKLPPCQEPWSSLYILRRGVVPCCYGCRAIAPMDRYREAWNSKLMQEIRADLAEGKFHAYCQESTACPIIRKHKAEGTAEAEPFQLRVKRLLLQVDRLAFGIPKKLYKAAKRATA